LVSDGKKKKKSNQSHPTTKEETTNILLKKKVWGKKTLCQRPKGKRTTKIDRNEFFPSTPNGGTRRRWGKTEKGKRESAKEGWKAWKREQTPKTRTRRN